MKTSWLILALSIALQCVTTAAPKGKITRATPTLGLYQASLGPGETKPGQRHKVRRGGKLIATLIVLRLQGQTAFCKLDKTASPGIPRLGDDIDFKTKPRPAKPAGPRPITQPTIAKVGTPNPRAEAAALFADKIEPVLARRCYSCHGREKQKSKLNLQQRNRRGSINGLLQILEPGSPDNSELLIRLTDTEDPMPPKGELLKPAEITAIRQWILAGAPHPGESNAPPPANGTARQYYPGGEKKSSIRFQNGVKHGPAIHWYPNGEKKSESTFLNGQLQGVSRYWYEDGQLQYEATYQRGVQHGPYRDWWPDGKPYSQENYVSGRKHGTWRAWWPTGKLSEQTTWRMGTLLTLREWDRDGNIRPSRTPGPTNDLDLLKPQSDPFAKSVPWTLGTGQYAIDRIYPGKPSSTIEQVFGRPQVVRGANWIYRNLEVTNPDTGERLKNVTFIFKNGTVSSVQVK